MTNQGHEELDEEQLHNLQKLIRQKQNSVDRQKIPNDLWKYCENAIESKKMDDSILLSLNSVGVDVLFTYLIQWFQKACEVTDRNLNQLTKDLDFNPNDIEKGRIDSFLAEVRALFFLRNKRFSDIRPLSRKKKRKQCDIFATRDSEKFAVEVFHTAKRPVPDLYDDKEFVHYLCNRFRNKKSQVDASLNQDDCQCGLFIYVLDRFAHQLNTSNSRFCQNLHNVFDELNWGEQYYFAIVTGYETNGILEDTIYPECEIL